MQALAAGSGDNDQQLNDLGPLAWVLEELRKSLDGASKAIRRFVRDAEMARGSDLESLDASQLRIARQQLHQAVGALEMVGLPEPAKVLRSMEALAQKFVERPESCSEEAATKVERAGFALVEYLEGVLRGKSGSPVALFPQYRDVLELVGEERIHPAELWPHAWRWIDVDAPSAEPLRYEPAVRTQLDTAVLKVVKSGSVSSAKSLRDVCLGLAAGQQTLEERAFWKIAAAYFEALALKLCPPDVYVKRAASRVLMQYTSLSKGSAGVSDRLAQDLLFFCAQAVPADASAAPVLAAVRQAYGLAESRAVNYETPQYGRFDPAVLVQARKRIATATETWSALSGGDTNRLKVVSEQFTQVGESLLKLHPENKELARGLLKAVDSTVRSGEPPTTPVAMEVATSILYLDAAYEDMDPTETANMRERSDRLARRLDHVISGGQPEPLEPWMEELYRRVSDRQTMGSVVEELRTGLTEIEKSLDTFFRNPKDKAPLNDVPNQLAQMRGVFSVLGLDQASLATVRMRDTVEKFLVDTIAEDAARSGVFEKFGNSLGALGFLIDMLSYQRALAKKLFVYDEEAGEFKPLMGREREAAAVAPEPLPLPVITPAPAAAAPAPAPAPARPAAAAAPAAADVGEDDGAELRDIFLEEAREVVRNGLDAVSALLEDPADLSQQTTLRRAFHTLKGSSRMVSFNEFGEAAWAMEQMMNSWLAEQLPARPELLQLSNTALQGLGLWVEDIAAGKDAGRSAAAFRQSADAMRLEGKLIPLPDTSPTPTLALPTTPAPAVAPAPEAPAVPDFASTQMFDFQLADAPVGTPAQAPAVDPALALGDVSGIDFGSLAQVPPAAPVAPAAPAPATELNLDWLSPEPEPAAPAAVELSFDLAPAASPAPAPSEPALELPELQNNWADTATGAFEDSVRGKGPDTKPAAIEGFEFDLPTPVQPPAPAEEQVKVIGTLRIGIPLYNVFLNEADEWSRRLLTELNEWSLELHNPVPDSAIALAHSLGGSSATVGFKALSEIARALEQAMQHVQLHGQGQPEHAQTFVAAADNIRHLLHQFAAGFLKSPEPGLVEALQAIVGTEFGPLDAMDRRAAADITVTESTDLDLGDLDFDFTAAPAAAPAPVPAAPLPPVQQIAPMPKPAPIAPVAPPAALRGAVQIVADDSDEDIDAVDVIDPDLFPIFEEEAAELMPQLASALRQWSSKPDDSGARLDVLRVLHTLKGSARLAGAMRLGEMAHRMESAIEQMGSEFVQSAQIEPMLGRYDRLQEVFDELCHGPAPEPVAAAPAPAPVPAAAPVAPVPTAAAPQAPKAAAPAPAPLPVARPAAVPAPAARPATPAAQRASSGQTVRVRSNLLDRLVNQAGEVMITRSRLDQRLGQLNGSLSELTANLDRLRTHLRDVELQAESQMQSRLAQAKDTAQGFDPLEFDRFTRVQELTRMMAESVNDVATVQRNLQQTISGTEDDLIAQGRQTRELQRDLLRTRMMEFEGISERLYGVVRQASKEAGKQVKLDITGGTMEIDRGVLDRMAPAFEHMLRNSVAHGIEAPQQREAAGKPAAGTITISLHQEGNDVSVTFTDDGAGLNLPRIREKAVANGLVAPGQPLSDADAANMIFMPGFSTASSVTELAGRGIGMDVVRSEVQALGGRIETATTAGAGTSFKLVLPLTTAVTQVIMLRMGELSVGVPANLVEIVRRLSRNELDLAYQQGQIDYGGELVPFFWSGALLQASARSYEQAGKTQPVVVLRSAGQRVAIHVDEVLGNQEVVVKNLGPQLSRLPGLAGMSVLASGAVVLIYNPVALATVYGEKAYELQQGSGEAVAPAVAVPQARKTEAEQSQAPSGGGELPLVLVVDDSITVRRVTQRLLRREGYRVALAADGLQALEQLAQERPAVVLSDIEMPRMDGFDLARNIRADAKLKDLPIIMITSRIAEKHREHAQQLGVNHYLGKPYSEDELLALVKHYCTQDVPA
ncbi:MAG: Hpt domain-containing protein [Hylemonella sp.]|uniref:hybrid sensor histidine kinase/response regulator n=1 Tax=Hylemonella sp. TaxID=2066020 RepID=UPI0022C5C704|nr:Hpt domain-containing protein [Hylemonella sp.]MCZ8252574.1 Hpt domain-containing protein [Hylemonella sp.]